MSTAPVVGPVARRVYRLPSAAPSAAAAAALHGTYYLATGLWPLVSMATFEAVTGPKTDDWLVQTVGVLVAVIGSVLLLAAVRRKVPLEIVVLAVASALALAVVDIVFVARRDVSPIYLLDALVEFLLIGLWSLAMAAPPRPDPNTLKL
jgi:hypothetical protein